MKRCLDMPESICNHTEFAKDINGTIATKIVANVVVQNLSSLSLRSASTDVIKGK